ncbi:MAG: response regulator [Lachnospiraceae bacterium]|nr:response regulator [Lachnospiraceae bacterium]MDD3617066.1 response regulator [Lachnospiraceae bacterium]
MRILAVDDEKIALSGLVSSIKKVVPDVELLGFQSPMEALEATKEKVFDVAFLDVEMREMDGITLAKRLKAIHPKINIIFTTGYMEYAASAIALRVSGYVSKPITPEKIRCEMDELRNPIEEEPKEKIRVKAFGNFEVYIGDKLLKFQNSKTKELFAYLIDRNGSMCTKREIINVLWDDDENAFRHNSYMNKLRCDLIKTLENEGFSHHNR